MEEHEFQEKMAELNERQKDILSLHQRPHDCKNHLELKIRNINNGEHYVYQCNECGEQRGGALSKNEAVKLLKGKKPNRFDLEIENKKRQESRLVADQISMLRSELAILQKEFYGEKVYLDIFESNFKKSNDVKNILRQKIDGLLVEHNAEDILEALVNQTVSLKKQLSKEKINVIDRFENEDELKLWLFPKLTEDFDVCKEVKGVHLAENIGVRIDYVLFPKKHLIEEGFAPSPFGIEVKYFKQESGFSKKTSRGFWQTISYNDCEFYFNEEKCKLKFCLLFSNLSFENEFSIVKNFGYEHENDRMFWIGLQSLANHAKVGVLEIKGTKNNYKGWRMFFSGANYFLCDTNSGTKRFKKSNDKTINKVRVGNF